MKTKLFCPLLLLAAATAPGTLAGADERKMNSHTGRGQSLVPPVEPATTSVPASPAVEANDPKPALQDDDLLMIALIQKFSATLATVAEAAKGGIVTEPSPEQALRTYQERVVRQSTNLAEFADQTCIEAEVSETSQEGQFCFIRSFSAPHSLVYSPLSFEGDSLIKNNVILRFVRSDVEHVQHGASLAILEANYKFSYKGAENVNGRLLYAFAIKPRRKSADLFKGKILVDAHTSCIIRAVGRVSKSPSWWIKRIDFIQDYAMVGDFDLPARTESVTQVRIIGRMVVTIRHSAYEVASKIDVPTKTD